MATERFANSAQTSLSAAISSGDTSLTVASASAFPGSPQFRVRIGAELLLVTAVGGTTWTVTRGVEGTTAAAHAAGDSVTQVLTAAAVGGWAALGEANTFTTGTQTIQTGAAGTVGQVVKGAASQTADLQQWQDSSGTALAAVSAGGEITCTKLSGQKSKVGTNAGTSVTLGSSDTGGVVETTSGSAVSVTLSETAAVGTSLTLTQAGIGQVTFAAGSGGTLRNRQSHTKTAGQWAAVNLYVRTNSGGSAAEWVLSGDTAA